MAVGASMLHCFFDFDGNYESRLDFSKTTHEKVEKLIGLQVLLLDEVSTWVALSTVEWEHRNIEYLQNQRTT